MLNCAMPTFIYRCPRVGLKVQGFIAEEIGENQLVSLTCIACTGVHLVDPTSAKVVGQDDDEDEEA
jgi:hypothetical protein